MRREHVRTPLVTRIAQVIDPGAEKRTEVRAMAGRRSCRRWGCKRAPSGPAWGVAKGGARILEAMAGELGALADMPGFTRRHAGLNVTKLPDERKRVGDPAQMLVNLRHMDDFLRAAGL